MVCITTSIILSQLLSLLSAGTSPSSLHAAVADLGAAPLVPCASGKVPVYYVTKGFRLLVLLRQASENAQRGEITRAAQCFRLAALRLGLGLRKCGRGPEHVLALKGPGILTPGPRLRPIKLAGLRDTAQETVRCEVQAVAGG